MADFHADGGARVARKEHTCSMCARTIAKGERYVWWSGVFDGEWFHGKAHLACDKAWWACEPEPDEPLPDAALFRAEILCEGTSP